MKNNAEPGKTSPAEDKPLYAHIDSFSREGKESECSASSNFHSSLHQNEREEREGHEHADTHYSLALVPVTSSYPMEEKEKKSKKHKRESDDQHDKNNKKKKDKKHRVKKEKKRARRDDRQEGGDDHQALTEWRKEIDDGFDSSSSSDTSTRHLLLTTAAASGGQLHYLPNGQLVTKAHTSSAISSSSSLAISSSEGSLYFIDRRGDQDIPLFLDFYPSPYGDDDIRTTGDSRGLGRAISYSSSYSRGDDIFSTKHLSKAGKYFRHGKPVRFHKEALGNTRWSLGPDRWESTRLVEKKKNEMDQEDPMHSNRDFVLLPVSFQFLSSSYNRYLLQAGAIQENAGSGEALTSRSLLLTKCYNQLIYGTVESSLRSKVEDGKSSSRVLGGGREKVVWVMDYVSSIPLLRSLLSSSSPRSSILDEKPCEVIIKQMHAMVKDGRHENNSHYFVYYHLLLSLYQQLYPYDQVMDKMKDLLLIADTPAACPLSMRLVIDDLVFYRQAGFQHAGYTKVCQTLSQSLHKMEEMVKNLLATLHFTERVVLPSSTIAGNIRALLKARQQVYIDMVLVWAILEDVVGHRETIVAMVQAMLWSHFPALCEVVIEEGENVGTAWDREIARPFEYPLAREARSEKSQLEPSSDLKVVPFDEWLAKFTTTPDNSSSPSNPNQPTQPIQSKPRLETSGNETSGPTDNDNGNGNGSGGKWVYSRVHGYRIFMPDEDEVNSSLAYQKVLGIINDQHPLFVSKGQAKSYWENTAEETKGVDVSSVTTTTTTLSSDPAISLSRYYEDYLGSLLQYHPLRSLSVEDEKALERQPERCVLFQDIHDKIFYEPLPRDMDIYQSVVIRLLQVLGLHWPLGDISHSVMKRFHEDVGLARFDDVMVRPMLALCHDYYMLSDSSGGDRKRRSRRRRFDSLRAMVSHALASSEWIVDVDHHLLDHHCAIHAANSNSGNSSSSVDNGTRDNRGSQLDMVLRIVLALLGSDELTTKFRSDLRRVYLRLVVLTYQRECGSSGSGSGSGRQRGRGSEKWKSVLQQARELVQNTLPTTNNSSSSSSSSMCYLPYQSVLGDLTSWAEYLVLHHAIEGHQGVVKIVEKVLLAIQNTPPYPQTMRISGEPAYTRLFPGLIRFYHRVIRLLWVDHNHEVECITTNDEAGGGAEAEAGGNSTMYLVLQSTYLLMQLAFSGALFVSSAVLPVDFGHRGDYCDGLGGYRSGSLLSPSLIFNGHQYTSPEKQEQKSAGDGNGSGSGGSGKKKTKKAVDLTPLLTASNLIKATQCYEMKIEDLMKKWTDQISQSERLGVDKEKASEQLLHGVEEVVDLDCLHEVFYLVDLLAQLRFYSTMLLSYSNNNKIATSHSGVKTVQEVTANYLEALRSGDEVFATAITRMRQTIFATHTSPSSVTLHTSDGNEFEEVLKWREERQQRVLRSFFPLSLARSFSSCGDDNLLGEIFRKGAEGLTRSVAESQALGEIAFRSPPGHGYLVNLEHLWLARCSFQQTSQLIFCQLHSEHQQQYQPQVQEKEKEKEKGWSIGRGLDNLLHLINKPPIQQLLLTTILQGLHDFPLNPHLLLLFNTITVFYQKQQTRRLYYNQAIPIERNYWNQNYQTMEHLHAVLAEAFSLSDGELIAQEGDGLNSLRDCSVSLVDEQAIEARVEIVDNNQIQPDCLTFLHSLHLSTWSWNTLSSLLAFLEKRLTMFSSAATVPLLWRIYLHLLLVQYRRLIATDTTTTTSTSQASSTNTIAVNKLRKEIQKVCYRALHHCGGCKMLYMDIMGPASVVFSEKELQSLGDLMESQGIYMRSVY